MKKTTFFFLFLAIYGYSSHAQAVPSTSAAVPITLGHSIVALTGPWMFHIGDDPRWADPKFDDSNWERVDLVSHSGSFDPITGWQGYVPGWTAKGHPGYWGYGWYRIHLKIDARQGERLALDVAGNVDDAFQAFADGTLLGSFGHFPAGSSHPVPYYSQPTMFQLPQSGATGSKTLTIALRVWMAPTDLQSAPDAGGLHNPPVLGQADAIAASYQLAWIHIDLVYISTAAEAALFCLLAVLAGCLLLFDRSDPAYRWLAVVFLLTALLGVYTWIVATTQLQSITVASIGTDVLLTPLTLGGWVMVWWAWFRLRRPAWMPKLIAAMTLLYMVFNLLGEDLFFTVIPHPVSVGFHLASLGVRILFLPLLVLIVVWGVREQGREGWLALPAVILAAVSQFQTELAVLHIRTNLFPFHARITLSQAAMLVLAFVLLVLLVRRLQLSLRRQKEMALDVKQAQEVQQVMLPGAISSMPGFAIESEYRPAREVGGDFFQIMPHPTDGSVLIVAGDVTGKGLQAGMLVALIVGAIRTAVEKSYEPLDLIEALNRRLCGRGNAHATCLALRITADGTATLANAGHMPPYLNGKELPMEGAVPLGMVQDAEFSVMHFHLTPDDRLTLLSDGVAEAQDQEGQLFGFERIHSLLQQPITAAEIAAAAQRFGQRDDISVLAVTLSPVLKEAHA